MSNDKAVDYDSENVESSRTDSIELRKSFFVRISFFLKQVFFELRKTIWPTKSETLQYTILVLIFVVVSIGIIIGFDFVVDKVLLPK